MALRDIGKFILIVFLLAQFIALISSMITYFDILHNIESNPMNPQNFLDIGNWIVEFLKGQIYGWPISIVITLIGYLLTGRKNSFEF